MLSSSDRERLTHILDAIDKIAEALHGLTYKHFEKDWQKQLVIERLLEIIGEAANHLTPEIHDTHSHVPWPQIIGMRNLVSHEYFRIDTETVWLTATKSVPQLRDDIDAIINNSPFSK